jgi:hypothetical protein
MLNVISMPFHLCQDRCICFHILWEYFFPADMIDLIKAALETNLPSFEAVSKILEDHKRPVSLNHLLNAIETYRKAKRTYEAIVSFEGEHLDVFGEHIGNNWLKRLPNVSKIRLHHTLPYTEHLAVLNQSKQVIIDPLEPHWILPALAAGCTPLGYELDNYQPQSWEKQTEQLVEFLHES